MGKRPASLRHLRGSGQVGSDKPRKYKNIKVVYDGRFFDSQRERDRYIELKLLEEAGEISKLRCQPKYKLRCGGTPVKIRSKGYPNGRTATYSADFRYVDEASGKMVVEDVKGYDTPRSRLKRAMIEAEYGFQVVLVR